MLLGKKSVPAHISDEFRTIKSRLGVPMFAECDAEKASRSLKDCGSDCGVRKDLRRLRDIGENQRAEDACVDPGIIQTQLVCLRRLARASGRATGQPGFGEVDGRII